MVLDHVAICVKDLQKGISFYEKLGLSFLDEQEEVPSQGVKTAFAPIDTHGTLELLSPLSEEGPIHKFIEKKGEGIHHLCFKVSDIEKKCEELEKEGVQFIYDKPQKGAHGAKVNFIHPKSSNGVLIELSEKS